MSNSEIIKRIRIYLSERDQHEGQPLYQAALERLRREGATGATVLRGLAGFGAGQRTRTAGVGELSSSPLVLEWVDRAERIARILPLLDEMLRSALITIEDVRVYRAVLRASGPFGERTVGQVMAHEPALARPDLPLRAAAEMMLERDQPLLPVTDAQGALVGVLSAGDLLRRFGLPLALLPALTPPERQALLERLPNQPLSEAAASDPRTIYVEAPIAQALSPMIEWGIDTLPVLDRDGRPVGLFGAEQVLRAALRPATQPDAAVRDAEPPTPVGLVMQRVTPTVPAAAPLASVIGQLLAAPDHFVVVVGEGRPRGLISDVTLTRQLTEPARAAWLAALREPGLPLSLPDSAGEPGAAGQLADAEMPTIGAGEPLDAAIRQMLAGGHDRLVVVEDGRLAGVLARRGLVRALAQASG